MDLGLAIEEDEENQILTVGTKSFMAPEILKSKKYSHKSDIFAMGVLYYALATGYYPFR